jgi:chromate reductase
VLAAGTRLRSGILHHSRLDSSKVEVALPSENSGRFPAETINLLGICGSLRVDSLNRRLLDAVRGCATGRIRFLDIARLPRFRPDVLWPGVPLPVIRARQLILDADAVIVATPEYNAGVPSVLLNALEWLSQPPRRSVLAGKPIAIVSASDGRGGGVALAHLRQVLSTVGAAVIPGQDFCLHEAMSKFDVSGKLVDENARARLFGIIDSLSEWTRVLRNSEERSLERRLVPVAKSNSARIL